MKLIGFSILLFAACGGSSQPTCIATPDLSLEQGCIWDHARCTCEGQDLRASDNCSPVPCGANESFNFVDCQCESNLADLSTTD